MSGLGFKIKIWKKREFSVIKLDSQNKGCLMLVNPCFRKNKEIDNLVLCNLKLYSPTLKMSIIKLLKKINQGLIELDLKNKGVNKNLCVIK